MTVRVAMVVDRFPNETFLASQVAALLERGLDLHVLCQIRDPHATAWSLLEGVDLGGRIHPWPDRGQHIRRAASAMTTVTAAAIRDGSSLRRARRVESARGAGRVGRLLFDARVSAVDPDVLHFQFADLARHRAHAAQAIDAAFTSSFRGYDLAYAGLDDADFYQPLWPVLDGAHTLGTDLQELAIARGCPPEVDWTIIPPAVDLARFQPIERLPGGVVGGRAVRVLSVGRLHWKKGYADALAAVAELKRGDRPVQYRIVGDGPAEEQVRWTVRDLDLEDSVELVGHRDQAEITADLQWADVFLHAALTEGFGNAVLEAQAMALPVVCTDAEGLAANVENGVTGFVAPRRRPERLAACLAQLADDARLRRRMGAAGRSRVSRYFALDAQTDAFIEFFERAAAGRSAGER